MYINAFLNMFLFLNRTFMKKRGEVVQDLDGEWRNGKILSGRQMDGHSCGPFVLMVFFSFIPSSKY